MSYVRLSTLSEGSLVKIKLANGNYEQYVVAKHNYESDLNGNGLTLLVSVNSIETMRYSNYGTQTVDWLDQYSTYNNVRSRLDSSEFQSRFQSRFLEDVKTVKVYYNEGGTSSKKSCNSKFFIPSATELGYSAKYSSGYISGAEGGTALSNSVIGQINKNNTWTRTIYNLEEEEVQTNALGEEVTFCYYGNMVIIDSSGNWSYSGTFNTHGYNLCFCLSGDAYVNADSNSEVYGEVKVSLDVECKYCYLGSMTGNPSFNYTVSTDIGLDVGVVISIAYGSNSKQLASSTISSSKYGKQTYTISISDAFIKNAPEGTIFTVRVTATAEKSTDTQTFMFSVGEVDSTPPYMGDENGLARHIKKVLLGVSDVARKIKKAYVGINGVAQLWFEGLPTRIACTFSSITAMQSQQWYKFAGTVTGNYGVFGGGVLNNSYTANVVAIDRNSLSWVNATSLTSARGRVVGTSAGNLGFIAGGGDGSSRYVTAFYYNPTLTMGSVDLSNKHVEGGSTQVGNYGLIAGGEASSNISTSHKCTTSVEAVNGSATVTSATALGTAVAGIKGCKFNNYGVLVGGYSGECKSSNTGITTAYKYSTSLTRSDIPSMSLGRHSCGVGASKKILIVAGGSSSCAYTYEMYSSDFTKIGGTYSMDYGGYLYGGFVNAKTDEYPDGMICFGNSSGIIGFNGTDGAIVISQSTGSGSAVAYDPLAAACFTDEVMTLLAYNTAILARFAPSN